jgi:hypothetical protein
MTLPLSNHQRRIVTTVLIEMFDRESMVSIRLFQFLFEEVRSPFGRWLTLLMVNDNCKWCIFLLLPLFDIFMCFTCLLAQLEMPSSGIPPISVLP